MSYIDDGLGTPDDWEIGNPRSLSRRYPSFTDYEAENPPDDTDPEDHPVYNVKLLRYNSYSKMCQAVVQPADGKSYYIEFRSWSFPDPPDRICLIRRGKNENGKWTMNRYIFGYGSLSDGSEDEN